jgi:hypothetical protein
MRDIRTVSTPVPNIEDRTLAEYWAGTSVGELRVQACGTCGAYRWPPRPACFVCHSLDVRWTPAPLTGELYTWTTVAFTALDGFKDLLPYAVGAIQLDSVPVRVTGYLDAEPSSLHVGERLRVEFIERDGGLMLPIWVPDAAAGGELA